MVCDSAQVNSLMRLISEVVHTDEAAGDVAKYQLLRERIIEHTDDPETDLENLAEFAEIVKSGGAA